MKKGDKLCFLVSEEDPRSSDFTLLIVALLSLGIDADADRPFEETIEMVDGQVQRRVVWALAQKSQCGKFRTRSMEDAWNDKAWIEVNPEHPLSYIQQALRGVAAAGRDNVDPLQLVRVIISGRFSKAYLPKDLDAAWFAGEWRAHNPEHPLAYLQAAWRNYHRIMTDLATCPPLGIVRGRGKRMAKIPMNASPEERAKYLDRLNRAAV